MADEKGAKDRQVEILRNIKKIREDQGLTQRAMARRLGTDASNYNKMENGKIGLKVSTIFHVADVLGVEPAVLFVRDPAKLILTWRLYQSLDVSRQDKVLAYLEEQALLQHIVQHP